jgi:hypothetical protein
MLHRNPIAFILLLASLSGCARYPQVPHPQDVLKDPGAQGQFEDLGSMRRGVPEKYLPAVEAIILAIEEDDNETARGILRALIRRGLDHSTMKLAKGFERLLDGRRRVTWLDLRLEATENPDQPAQFRLELVVSHHGSEVLNFRPGGARLFVQQVAVGADGSGQRGSRRDAVPFPEELNLVPGEEQRFEVAQLHLAPPAGVLAFSSRLRLDLLPGQFRMEDGRYLPAQNVDSPRVELVRLAGKIPNLAVEPEELTSYASGAHPNQAALMERAVRIAPEHREAALDQLTALVARTDIVTLESLVPVLRWLSHTDSPGGDPKAWRSYMERRGLARQRSAVSSTLRLPGS